MTPKDREHRIDTGSPWIRVEDRLPRVGEKVWIVFEGVVQTVAYRLAGRGFACEDGYEWMTVPEVDADPLTNMEAVTHWMPMPEPPKETK